MDYFVTDGSLFRIEDKSSCSGIVFDAAIGTLVSFKVHDREVLYFSNSDACSANIDNGGIPILFPVCGALSEDTYSIGSKHYTMPKHGFAFGVPWTARSVQGDEGGEIQTELHADERTLKSYPFNFTVNITYKLKKDDLLIDQEYCNNGQEIMMFYSGLHPYFIANNKKNLIFDINAESFGDDSSGEMLERIYTGKVDFDRTVDFIFRLKAPFEQKYSYTDHSEKRKIIIETGAEFKYMVMWTKDAESSFICLEPWMAEPDAMNTGKDMHLLKPGESLKTWIRISVRDM